MSVLLAVVAAAGVFGSVSLDALAAESTFEAGRLEEEVRQMRVRYDELSAEVAALESPAHVRRVAVDELGMVAAETVVHLRSEVPAAHTGPVPLAEVARRDPTVGSGP